MRYFSFLFPFAIGASVLLASATLGDAARVNILAQALLFVAVVCIPLHRTGRMSYVDIGWPVGIVVIGCVSLFVLEGSAVRRWLIAGVYVVIGSRMSIMAIRHWFKGALNNELPRYAYQRRRWEKTGKTNTMLAAQIEVIAQGAFNATFLSVPAFVMASNTSPALAPVEVIGLAVWLLAFVFEETADRQKRRFIRQSRERGDSKAVCDAGLWSYSRQPNYFGQWMGWNGILIAATPSWLAMFETEPLVLWIAAGLCALLVSYYMYNTLVYYSGAVPSEYYSVRKRPGFAEYQRTTSQFFPRPPRDPD